MQGKTLFALVLFAAGLAAVGWTFWRNHEQALPKPQVSPGFASARLKGGDHPDRERAIQVMGNLKDPVVVPKLAEVFKDGTKIEQTYAVQSLIKIGGDQAEKTLITVAKDNSDGFIRTRAVQGLGVLKSDQAVKEIAQRLADPDQRVVFAASRALGRIGSNAAVPALRESVFSGDPLRSVYAIRALHNFRGTEAEDVALDGFEQLQGKMLRGYCLAAVAEIGTGHSLAKLREWQTGPAGENWRQGIKQAIGEIEKRRNKTPTGKQEGQK